MTATLDAPTTTSGDDDAPGPVAVPAAAVKAPKVKTRKVKQPKPEKAPKPTYRLRLRRIDGNLARTGSTITAWYHLPASRWAYVSDAQRAALIMDVGNRLAALGGHDVHLRVTSRPYPIRDWVQALDKNTPHPHGGKARGSWWDQHLVRQQRHLAATTLAEKEVYLGVVISPRSKLFAISDRVLGRPPVSEDEALADALSPVNDTIAGPGLSGRPVTAAELEWLIRRSAGLGLPAPVMSPSASTLWDPEDTHTFTDDVVAESRPLSRTVKVTDSSGNERWVAVLAIGRTDEIVVPPTAHEPWMSHADRLPFNVEWSVRGRVLTGERAAPGAHKKLLIGRDMQKAYIEHDMDLPLDVERKIDQARLVGDEMREASAVTANRFHGYFRLAVSGRTEKECLERVRAVTDTYRPLLITVEHPKGQLGLLREFIPCERLSSAAYMRRFPILYFAAAVPTVASALGDRQGTYIGYSVGGCRRPVTVDVHFGTEVRESSGLMPIVGGLGSGKSTIMGVFAHDSAMRGIQTTLWDPSGPLAALCDMACFHDPRTGRSTAKHLDLVTAAPGTLSPWAVVPEPNAAAFDEITDLAQRQTLLLSARLAAQATRKSLALDVCRMLLPPQIDALAQTQVVLREAIRAVGGATRGVGMLDVIEKCREHKDPHGTTIAGMLMDQAEHPLSRLYFESGDNEGAAERHDGELLTVITAAGLTKPDLTAPRDTWSAEESLAIPVLHLATFYTSSRVYRRGRHVRKVIGLDEAHFIGDWASGRALFSRLATDSRKYNAAVMVASQNASAILSMNIANFVGHAFVGNTRDRGAAADALTLLGVETGVGYEASLATLSPIDVASNTRSGVRHFVYRDYNGGIDRVRIDLTANPELQAVLDTTADPNKPAPPVTLEKESA